MMPNSKALRALVEAQGYWHGVFLDGRNEHGSHVVMLLQRSFELEQDEAGAYAEAILVDAEAKGFPVGSAVIARFERYEDEDFFSHFEFIEVSSELTELFYGTADDAPAAEAHLASSTGVEGWVTVPVEPTEAMLDAYWHQCGESREMRERTHAYGRRYYQAMVAAAPLPASPSPEKEGRTPQRGSDD